MNKVLVTGANGFVGRALCPLLVSGGWQVCSGFHRKGEDRVDAESSDSIFYFDLADTNPDYSEILSGMDSVVHLAAKVHDKGDQDEYSVISEDLSTEEIFVNGNNGEYASLLLRVV